MWVGDVQWPRQWSRGCASSLLATPPCVVCYRRWLPVWWSASRTSHTMCLASTPDTQQSHNAVIHSRCSLHSSSKQQYSADLQTTQLWSRWHLKFYETSLRKSRGRHQTLSPVWDINFEAGTPQILKQLIQFDQDLNPVNDSNLSKSSTHHVKPPRKINVQHLVQEQQNILVAQATVRTRAHSTVTVTDYMQHLVHPAKTAIQTVHVSSTSESVLCQSLFH